LSPPKRLIAGDQTGTPLPQIGHFIVSSCNQCIGIMKFGFKCAASEYPSTVNPTTRSPKPVKSAPKAVAAPTTVAHRGPHPRNPAPAPAATPDNVLTPAAAAPLTSPVIALPPISATSPTFPTLPASLVTLYALNASPARLPKAGMSSTPFAPASTCVASAAFETPSPTAAVDEATVLAVAATPDRSTALASERSELFAAARCGSTPYVLQLVRARLAASCVARTATVLQLREMSATHT
jgi:hypothetical protein